MNNKGFTLVELLAVITLMGLLTTIGGISLSRYISKARQEGYDSLAKSAYHAAEEYVMDHPSAIEIGLNELKEGNYLDSLKDPGNKDRDCTGTVEISKKNNDSLDYYSYKVKIKCTNYEYEKNY